MGKQFKGFIFGFILACLLVVPTTALADNIQAYFNTVNLSVDGKVAANQGENYQLSDGSSVPFSITYKGTTYIPIRKVSELIGVGINYDNASKTVQITTNNTNQQGKTDEKTTTGSAVTYNTSYSVFNECNKDTNESGQKVTRVIGYKDGAKLDTTVDYSYFDTISSKLKSIQLWETKVDGKGNITKVNAVSASKSGKVISSDSRNSVTLSSGEYDLEKKVAVYQWNDDNEYKYYSGSLKKDYNVYLYDTDGNKKYDVIIFTKTSSSSKPSKTSIGYSVINECNKTVNEDGKQVQQILGFNDGTHVDALTSDSNIIKDWNEPKYSNNTFSNTAVYKINFDSKGVIVSADKVSPNFEQGTVEKADKRNTVTIGGKTYQLSENVIMYRVTEDGEYKLTLGNVKQNDIVQLYDTDSSKDGYEIVIFFRP